MPMRIFAGRGIRRLHICINGFLGLSIGIQICKAIVNLVGIFICQQKMHLRHERESWRVESCSRTLSAPILTVCVWCDDDISLRHHWPTLLSLDLLREGRKRRERGVGDFSEVNTAVQRYVKTSALFDSLFVFKNISDGTSHVLPFAVHPRVGVARRHHQPSLTYSFCNRSA